MSNVAEIRRDLEETVFSLNETRQDPYAPKSAIEGLTKEKERLEAKLAAALLKADSDEEEEEESNDEGEEEEEEERGSGEHGDLVDGEEGDFEFDEEAHEEILEEGDEIPNDAYDMTDAKGSDNSEVEAEVNPLAMPAKLRRELGDINAEILDEYALSVQKKTTSFLRMLRAHLDLGEVDASDGNNELIEILLDEVGKKGVAKIRTHFAEWREFVMGRLAKEMQAMFRAAEPEAVEEVAVQVPVVDREEIIDGVDEKAAKTATPSLNAPPPVGQAPRAKRTPVAPVAPVAEPIAEEDEEDEGEVAAAAVDPDPVPAKKPFVVASGRVTAKVSAKATDFTVGTSKPIILT